MTKAENDAISNNPEEKKIAVFGPGLGRSVNSNINEEVRAPFYISFLIDDRLIFTIITG